VWDGDIHLGVVQATSVPWKLASARPASRSADSGSSLPQGDSCSTRTPAAAPGSQQRRAAVLGVAPPPGPPPYPSLTPSWTSQAASPDPGACSPQTGPAQSPG